MDLTNDLTPALADNRDKKIALFIRQKNLLDTFLEHGAITRAQYNKSLHDLTEKMGIADADNPAEDYTDQQTIQIEKEGNTP